MHHLLARQLKKVFNDKFQFSPKLKTFLKVIGDTYDNYDKDHKLLERSFDLSSKEFSELNNRVLKLVEELKIKQESVENRVKKRTFELEQKTKDLEDTRSALMNILEDVEEARKGAEEERDKTEIVISNFTDGLMIFDNEGKLSLINPQVENFFRIKSKEVEGKAIAELAENPKLNSLTDFLGKGLKGIYRKELSVKENLVLEVSVIPTMSGMEKTGDLVILHDISREKTIERIKTEFVSLTAHQLRTPLSAIKWTLKMFLDGDIGKITEEQRTFIEKSYQSNERMIGLINDLLDVTRMEEGRYLYKPSSADLKNIVQFVVNSYQDQIKKKNLKLEFKKTEAKLPQVNVDVEKIRLAIQNLFDNAIRYTLPGGEIIVSLKYDSVKKEMEFQIRDTGIGVPDDQKGRVFAKFFRAVNASKIDAEGSGLGLFITKNIIEAHGGRIWFESEAEKGTTFYFTLPIKEEFVRFIEEF